MSDKRKVYENGRLSKEITTNSGPRDSEVTHVQNVHQGSLGIDYKTTDAVITTHKNGDVSIKR